MAKAESSGGSRNLAAFLLGAAMAGAFFGVLSLPQFQGAPLKRYVMSHDVEIVAVCMACWGLADLLLKWRTFGRQRRALRHAWIDEGAGRLPAAAAAELHRRIEAAPTRLRETWIARRLLAGLHYVKEKGSPEGLEEHLGRLADSDADKSHVGYALVRMIAWMIPILGFLGTVVGITIAVANVSPDQLDSSLTQVTGGLAMAFDATAVALALAMGLMFCYFVVERAEQNLLHGVDDRAGELLRHRFEVGDPASAPYLESLSAVAGRMVAHVETLVERQAEIWSLTLATLADREREAHAGRASAFAAMLDELRAERKTHATQARETAALLASVDARLADSARHLAAIAGDGKQLATLQQSLTQNLVALRETQGLDDALHSLTAAIHLITARTRSGGYGEKAA